MSAFKIVHILLVCQLSTILIDYVHSVEETDISENNDRTLVLMSANTPDNDVLVELYMSNEGKSIKFHMELTRRQMNEFSACLCDLENKGCTVRTNDVEIQTISSEEFKNSFFTENYFCEPYPDDISLLSCTRLETTKSLKNCDRRRRWLCSPFLQSTCPLFPMGVVTCLLSTGFNVSISAWSSELDGRFSTVGQEKNTESVTDQCRMSETKTELTTLNWILLSTIIILTIVLIVMIIAGCVIYRRRRRQMIVPSTSEARQGRNSEETNNDYNTFDVDQFRSFATDQTISNSLNQIPAANSAFEMSEYEVGSTFNSLNVLTSLTPAVQEEPAYVNGDHSQGDVGRSCQDDNAPSQARQQGRKPTFKELLAKETARTSYV